MLVTTAIWHPTIRVYILSAFTTTQTALVSTTLANPNIHWEEVAQTNIGVDASLFNSRVMFSLDAYHQGDERHAGEGFHPHHIGI